MAIKYAEIEKRYVQPNDPNGIEETFEQAINNFLIEVNPTEIIWCERDEGIGYILMRIFYKE